MTKEQKALVEKNHNLIFAFLKTHHLSVDEYYDLAAIGLCRAAMEYDENISKFSTFAYQCMLSIVLQDIYTKTRAKRIPKEIMVSLNYETEMDDGKIFTMEDTLPSPSNTEDEAVTQVMVVKFKEKLKPKQKCIFEMMLNGYSQADIAKEMNCTRQSVSKHKIEIENRFKGYFCIS